MIAAGDRLLGQSKRVSHGLETWFTLPGREMPKPPPPYKMAITAWLAIFPLVLALSYALGPLLGGLPLPVRILISTLFLTPVMTWVAMPWLTRLLWPWLYPGVPKPS